MSLMLTGGGRQGQKIHFQFLSMVDVKRTSHKNGYADLKSCGRGQRTYGGWGHTGMGTVEIRELLADCMEITHSPPHLCLGITVDLSTQNCDLAPTGLMGRYQSHDQKLLRNQCTNSECYFIQEIEDHLLTYSQQSVFSFSFFIFMCVCSCLHM